MSAKSPFNARGVPRHTQAAKLTLDRLAGGVTLGRLCHKIERLAEPHPDVDTRGPGERYDDQTRVELIDSRSVGANRLKQRGITPRMIHFSLTNLVPSVLSPQRVEATKVDVDFSREDEYYIALQFKDKDATKLLDEREAVWKVLGKLGHFSIDEIPWIGRIPDVRLAYIPTDGEVMDPHNLADNMEKAVHEALPFSLSLAPAYDRPFTI
jgi:hypothetical protein